MKLSVVIPVYNEKNTIGEVLQRVRTVDVAFRSLLSTEFCRLRTT